MKRTALVFIVSIFSISMLHSMQERIAQEKQEETTLKKLVLRTLVPHGLSSQGIDIKQLSQADMLTDFNTIANQEATHLKKFMNSLSFAFQNRYRVSSVCGISGSEIAFGDKAGRIGIVNFKDRIFKYMFEQQGPNAVANCLLLLDATKMASGLSNGIIKIWDLTTYTSTVALSKHESGVGTLIRITDDTLASSGNRVIKIWNLITKTCSTTLSGHNHYICSLVHVGKNTIASGSGDGQIKIWDLKKLKCTVTLEQDARCVVESLLAICDTTLVCGCTSGCIHIWNLQTKSEVSTNTGEGTTNLVSVGDDYLACGGASGIKIWDLKTKNWIAKLNGYCTPVDHLARLANGNLVSAAYEIIRLWPQQAWNEEYKNYSVDQVAYLLTLARNEADKKQIKKDEADVLRMQGEQLFPDEAKDWLLKKCITRKINEMTEE